MVNDVKIRSAGSEDLEKLAMLKYELDEYHKDMPIWPPECDMDEARAMMKEVLEDSNSAVFIAESGGNAVGFVTVAIYERKTVHPDYRKIGIIDRIFVREDYRGKGIGRQLVKACIEYLEKEGISQVTLRSVVFNESAGKFWEKLSFHSVLYVRTTSIEKVRKSLKNHENQIES